MKNQQKNAPARRKNLPHRRNPNSLNLFYAKKKQFFTAAFNAT